MAKRGPRFFVCPLFGLLLRCFCFVCLVSSASDRSNAKRSAKFFKMAKANHIKIFIFGKHFSRSLINIYDLICSCLGISIFFTFLLSFQQKECFKNSFQHIFTISDIRFDLIQHKYYYDTKIWSLWTRKKIKTTSAGLRKCQQEQISRNWLKLAKNKQTALFLSKFSAPKVVRSSRN